MDMKPLHDRIVVIGASRLHGANRKLDSYMLLLLYPFNSVSPGHSNMHLPAGGFLKSPRCSAKRLDLVLDSGASVGLHIHLICPVSVP